MVAMRGCKTMKPCHGPSFGRCQIQAQVHHKFGNPNPGAGASQIWQRFVRTSVTGKGKNEKALNSWQIQTELGLRLQSQFAEARC